MVRIIRNNLPTHRIVCGNCGSELEYTRADAVVTFEERINKVEIKNYKILCPVCDAMLIVPAPKDDQSVIL